MTEPFKISECERELKSMYEKTRSLSSRYGLQKQFAEFDLDYQRDKKANALLLYSLERIPLENRRSFMH